MRLLLLMLLLVSVISIVSHPAVAQQCRRDGNANQDAGLTPADALFTLQQFLHPGASEAPFDTCGQQRANVHAPQESLITPADAHLILQHFLGTVPYPLGACAQARGDVCVPPAGPERELTAADAVCILQAFLGRSSCLDAVVPMAARLTGSP